MYKKFFGLRENPFNVNPDPRYLFLTPQTREALDDLTYGIQARQGLILLTGEVGTGKTTLIYRLLEWLHKQQTPTAFIFNSHLEINHLFDFILADFGVPLDSGLKRGALMRLNLWLMDRYRAGETPVLIVDEAQGLPSHVLEEIRMLLNLETPREKLLQIVLAGQPELEVRINRPELRQIKQRIALRCKTAALTLPETHDYIQARLQIAGAGEGPVFAPEAMDAVHFYSRGIPRVTNLLCEHALINAYVEHVRPVPARLIAEVAHEFQFDEMSRVAPSQVSVDAMYSNLISMPESLASVPVHPSAAAGPILVRKQYASSPGGRAAAIVAAGAIAGPASQAAATTLHCEMILPLQESPAALNSTGAPSPEPGAQERRRIERPLVSGPPAFTPDATPELIAELALMQTRPAASPRLHVVEQKASHDISPAPEGPRVSSPSKPVHPRVPVRATKSASIRSVHKGIRPFRVLLADWDASRRNRVSSKAASTARTPTSVISHRQLKRAFHPFEAWYTRCVVWRDKSLTVFGPVDWSRLRGSVLRWLQQPSNPAEWRLADSHLSGAWSKVRQKKR
ncbi:MAG: AAA family ATPase [Candidatus Acidiferrales bacterium]